MNLHIAIFQKLFRWHAFKEKYPSTDRGQFSCFWFGLVFVKHLLCSPNRDLFLSRLYVELENEEFNRVRWNLQSKRACSHFL